MHISGYSIEHDDEDEEMDMYNDEMVREILNFRYHVAACISAQKANEPTQACSNLMVHPDLSQHSTNLIMFYIRPECSLVPTSSYCSSCCTTHPCLW